MNGLDIRFQGPYAISLLLAPVAVAMLIAYARYLRRVGFASPLPVILRAASFLLLLILVAGPAIYTTEKKPARGGAAVLVDVSQSMRMRDGKSASRLERALKDAEKFVKEYGGEPELYVYSGESRNIVSIKELKSEKAIGSATRASEGVRAAAAGSNADLSDIVLFTDGNESAGFAAPEAPPGVRVHAMGYGHEKPGANCGIKEISAPEYGFLKKPFEVAVDFYASGVPAGQKIGVELFEGNRRAAQAVAVSAGPQLENYRIKLSYSPQAQGRKALSVSVKIDMPEMEKADNTGAAFVEIISDRKSVLYIDSPGWDYRFLSEFLAGEKKMNVETVLAGPGRTFAGSQFRKKMSGAAGLSGYRLVIVGNVAAHLSSGEKAALADYLSGGGNMVITGGANSLFADRGEWKGILGVQKPEPAGDSDGFEARPTQKGLESPLLGMSGGAATWKKLPVLQTFHRITVPPGGETLATHPWLKCGAGACPVIYSFAVGRGEALAFAVGGLWRWRFSERNPEYYDELWSGVVSEMMESARRSPLEISIRDDVVKIGESFEIAVNANDEKIRRGPAPVAYAKTPGESAERKLAPSSDGKQGANVYTLEADREGPYSFRAKAGGASAGPVSGFAGVEPEEYKNIGINGAFFEKIKTSGGSVANEGGGASLARELRKKARYVDVRTRRSPMNSPWALAALAALLTLEWVSRRRGGLT